MSGPLRPAAILFDLYRTLLDIWTDEQRPEVWQKLARFLRYGGLPADAAELQEDFLTLARVSQERSLEAHPEVDVLGVFRRLLSDLGHRAGEELVVATTCLFRTLSIVHFEVFPDALPTLAALRERFKLGLVSDAQRVFLEPEIRMAGLAPLLDAIVVSSDHGFHKPDPRMFRIALGQLGVAAGQAIHVGDSPDRDVAGAQAAGLHAVLLARSGSATGSGQGCRPDRVVATLDELREWLLVS